MQTKYTIANICILSAYICYILYFLTNVNPVNECDLPGNYRIVFLLTAYFNLFTSILLLIHQKYKNKTYKIICAFFIVVTVAFSLTNLIGFFNVNVVKNCGNSFIYYFLISFPVEAFILIFFLVLSFVIFLFVFKTFHLLFLIVWEICIECFNYIKPFKLAIYVVMIFAWIITLFVLLMVKQSHIITFILGMTQIILTVMFLVLRSIFVIFYDVNDNHFCIILCKVLIGLIGIFELLWGIVIEKEVTEIAIISFLSVWEILYFLPVFLWKVHEKIKFQEPLILQTLKEIFYFADDYISYLFSNSDNSPEMQVEMV